MKINVLRSLLTIAVALVLLSGLASAGTIGPYTTTTPIVARTTDFGNTGTDNPPIPSGTASLSFAKFDTTLGTLNSVTITLNDSFSTVLTVTNTSATTNASGYIRTEVQIAIGSGLGDWMNNSTDTTLPKFNYTLLPLASTTSGTLTGTDSSTGVYTSGADAAIIALFEAAGGGTYNLPVGTFTDTLQSNTGGNTNSGQVTSASITGTVTYDYTPPPSGAPEPATMALLGSALVGLAVLGRKRFAR
jgi:hypothetical protein